MRRKRDDRPRSLAEAARRGLIPACYLDEAIKIMYDLADNPPTRRVPTRTDPSYKNDPDPWWDNNIRVYDEDY